MEDNNLNNSTDNNNNIDTNNYNNSNESTDNICLICYIPVNKIIILCKDCKFLYCESCANKIKYCCAVCNRRKEVVLNNYHNPNRIPLYLTCTFSIFFFLFMILLYVIVFTTFSYYFFVNYDPTYKFILFAKQNNLINKIVYLNQNITKLIPNNSSNILDFSTDLLEYFDMYDMCFP